MQRLANISYGPHGRDNTLDVYIPEGSHYKGVILYVHGGAFRYGSKNLYFPVASHYAREGYLTFNINYRRKQYPQPLIDVLEAYDWVARNCGRYGGSSAKIILAGDSAGGNLCLAAIAGMYYNRPESWLSTRTTPPPAAVILGSPVLQVRVPPGRMPRWANLIFTEMREHYDPKGKPLASPVHILREEPHTHLPPMLTLYGDRDPLMDDLPLLESSLMDTPGGPFPVKIYHRQIHAFHIWPYHDGARVAWKDQMAFLDEHVPSLSVPRFWGTNL